MIAIPEVRSPKPPLLPWQKPLVRKLPEPVTCIGCGRNEHQLREAGSRGWGLCSLVFGIGVCWGCGTNDEHEWVSEYRAAIAALIKTARERDVGWPPSADSSNTGTAEGGHPTNERIAQ